MCITRNSLNNGKDWGPALAFKIGDDPAPLSDVPLGLG
jgi:hypothetical protein